MLFKNYQGREVSVDTNDARDDLITAFGKQTLEDRYNLPGETYQGMFARVSAAYSDTSEMAQRVYDYMSRQWFMPSTPVLSNGGTDRGNPISCFLNAVPDSMEGIRDVWSENVDLASQGGGIGTYWGDVRGIDEKVGLVGKTSGIIPFIHVQDSLTLAISQGSLRRGSAAVYLDISHPEIVEFLEVRKPTGDPNRKSLNLHHGVNISDAFMEAMLAGDDWQLVSPKDGSVRQTVKARDLWQRLLTMRVETGEPYIIFSDTVDRLRPEVYKRLGFKVKQSNLCVAPETLILTDQGHVQIASKWGKRVKVWNGHEWSSVIVEKTGENQPLLTVKTSDGASLDCTEYHKFYVLPGYSQDSVEVRAGDLTPGMKLMKGELPVIEGGEKLDYDAYGHGFYCGDGCDYDGYQMIYFYNGKRTLADRVLHDLGPSARILRDTGGERHIVKVKNGYMAPKFTVPVNGVCLEDRLAWFAGLCDSDGTLTRNGESQSIQVANTNLEFLGEVRLMLQTLGVSAKIRLMSEEGMRSMPDGRGGLKDYFCKDTYRLMFGENGLQKLLALGFSPRRLEPVSRQPQRECSQFIKVVSVTKRGRLDDTYCFNEPKRHMGVFNGILTGQCSEISLTTGLDHLGVDRTAVCCLASVNMATMDEWFGDTQFLRDCLVFLDNVLQSFIIRNQNVPAFKKACWSAMRERSIGLGVMGFHSYLQDKGIPFESAMASAINRRLFKWMHTEGAEINRAVAGERLPCPDARDAGLCVRWSHIMAVAPTASISIICGGTSAGVEPWASNLFTQKTLSGSFEVRNQALERLIRTFAEEYHYALDATGSPEAATFDPVKFIDDAWQTIKNDEGSVMGLDFLTQDEKDTFKTAFEIDQRWIIEHAAARAPFVDQMVSNNLFILADAWKQDIHNLHVKAWREGVPSLYYCRSKALQRGTKVENLAGEMPQASESPQVVLALAPEGPMNPNDFADCLSCQ